MSDPVANMQHLVAHLKTLLPQRREKRRRDDDDDDDRVTRPRTQDAEDVRTVVAHVGGTSQIPVPNKTT